MDPSMLDDEVVISGIGGRFPECSNLEELKNALFNQTDVITNNDLRWKPGKLGVPSQTGKVYGIDLFDTAFFGMHRKLTDATDPMSRILMEEVFEAVLDAGLNPQEIRGSSCGVFISSALSESENIFITLSTQNGFGIMGHNRSMMANRISYWLDLKGPSFSLDSSLCSSLKGLQMGKEAIENGECDIAIVGAAVLSFHAEISVHYDDMEVLSGENFNRPFDENAQGYPRSETIAVMILQKRSAAKRVYASVCQVDCCYFGDDQPGPFVKIVPDSMEKLLREFYKKSVFGPEDIEYLETVGTGVKWMDELEIKAVDNAICSQRSKPLPIGTVTSNVGYCEAASGLVGACKMIIAMETGIIPATLHHEIPNPNLNGIVEGRMQVITENLPWKGGLVAINSFGVGNVFGHCVLRSFSKDKKPPPPTSETIPRLIFLSARHEEGIKSIMELVDSRPVDYEYGRLLHDVFGSHIFSHLYRGYTFMPALPSQSEMLPYSGSKRPVWFVYSGMGSQWAGMGRDLMKIKVFADVIERCHKALEPHGVDIKSVITTDDETIFDNILNSFVGIAAVQIGLTDILRAIGIEPDGIIGHSVGELGCAYADGCFTAEQMILAAHARGRASIETELIRGTMAAVGMGYKQIKDSLPEPIEVACHNSKTSCTISGPDEDMVKYVSELKEQNIFAKAVNVSNIAYHSRYIAPAGPKLLSLLKEVIPSPEERSPRWVSTSVPEEQWDSPLAKMSSPEYHTNNLLSSVLFEEASTKIPDDAIVIEIAPHGLLQAILRRSLKDSCINIPLTKRGAEDGSLFLLQAIGKMFLAGMQPKVQNIYEPIEYPVSRGTPSIASLVTWEHSDVWYTGRATQMKSTVPAEDRFSVTLRDLKFKPYIHYLWKGHSVFSPAQCLEIVSRKIRDIKDDDDLTIVFEDVQFHHIVDIPYDEPMYVHVLYQRGSGRFEVTSDLELLATGRAYCSDKAKEKLWTKLPAVEETTAYRVLGKEQVYIELLRRGLDASCSLAGINDITYYEKDWVGTVSCDGNEAIFLDNLLQVPILKASGEIKELHRPVRIKRLCLLNGPCPVDPQMPLRYNVATGVIQAGNIEVFDVRTDVFPLKPVFQPLLLHSSQFISHSNPSVESRRQVVALVVQLARYHQSRLYASIKDTQLEVLELKSCYSLQEDLNTIASRLTNVNVALRDAVTTTELLQEANKAALLVAAGPSINIALSLLRYSFLLIRTPVEAPAEPSGGWDRSIARIIDVTVDGERYQLLKRVVVDDTKGTIFHVKESDDVAKLKLSTRGITYLVWNKLPEAGLDSVLDKVRGIPGGHRTRCVFTLDEGVPPFNPLSPFYANQLSLGLWVNVYFNGCWGHFYCLPIQNEVMDAELPKNTVPLNAVSGLDPRDILCLGLNPLDPAPCGQRAYGDIGPADFVALQPISFPKSPLKHRRRIMGLAAPSDARAALSLVPGLTWLVPDEWSAEDAATVPYAYSMAYHAVIDLAVVKEDEYVLIHDGTTPVGQAAIRVALSRKCKIITSVSCDEERALIKQIFPEIPEDHILDISDEECDVKIKYLIKGKGIMCSLSNVRGEALLATFRCTNSFGIHVQFGTEDAKQNKTMGTFTFVQSASFYSRNSTFLTDCDGEMYRERTRDMVQHGIDTGVVQPLKRVVFDATQADLAISKMNQTRNKVIVILQPDFTIFKLEDYPLGSRSKSAAQAPEKSHAARKSPEKSGTKIERYKCNPDASYLIIGGRNGFAIDILEWLLERGAQYVIMADGEANDSNSVYKNARRFMFLEKYYSANITVAPSDERPDNPAGANTLLQRARASKPIGTIFILPMDEPFYGLVLQHVEEACLIPEFAKTAVIVMRRGGHSQRAVAVCERRRRSGMAAGLIDVGTVSTYFSLLPLDQLMPLASSAPTISAIAAGSAEGMGKSVGSHSVLCVIQQAGRQDENTVLSEFLPRSLDAAVALGQTLSPDSYYRHIATQCVNYKHVREVPPIFLVAGLTDSPIAECKSIAENLVVPAVVLYLSENIRSITEGAKSLVQIVLSIQPEGPYTILGTGWGGAVALELSLALEALVPKERWDKNSNAVFLIDGAPDTVRQTLNVLGDGRAFEAKLLCQLLHLDIQVFDYLEGLASWDERVKEALALLPSNALIEEHTQYLVRSYHTILNRLQMLRAYEGPSGGRRLRGEVTLIRPAGFNHNYRCGLEVYVEGLPLVHTPSSAAAGDFAKTWHEAGSVISAGVRVGNKKMSLARNSCNNHIQLVWQKLR